jgi:hypothetical protein
MPEAAPMQALGVCVVRRSGNTDTKPDASPSDAGERKGYYTKKLQPGDRGGVFGAIPILSV